MSNEHERYRRDAGHYSYTVYETDAATRGFDSARFNGTVGRFFQQHQERFILDHLGDVTGMRILDLGAGTGRLSLPMARHGARVTAADASDKMLAILREKAWLQGLPVTASRIDAHALPFPDTAFEAAVSLRMIMHVVDWHRVIAELCRVAKTHVIVDFPPRSGFAGLAPMIHPMIRPFNPHHQPYRVFRIDDIGKELAANGFVIASVDRHVVLPFGLHRSMNSIAFTRKIESVLDRIGLRRVMGAPVTVCAQRKDLASCAS
ncbi:methyltransferase domain-containing protein [bacterium]|nr:methyltransferase domain-containing protein [candidate division CSSED10-310 bacterium]